MRGASYIYYSLWTSRLGYVFEGIWHKCTNQVSYTLCKPSLVFAQDDRAMFAYIYIYFACQFCCQAEVQCRESGEFTWPLVATYGTSRGLCRLLGLQPPTELILLYQVGQNEQFTSELQTRPANAEGLYMAIPFTTLRQFSIIIFHMSNNSHVKQPGWTLLWRRR